MGREWSAFARNLGNSSDCGAGKGRAPHAVKGAL